MQKVENARRALEQARAKQAPFQAQVDQLKQSQDPTYKRMAHTSRILELDTVLVKFDRDWKKLVDREAAAKAKVAAALATNPAWVADKQEQVDMIVA